MLFPSPSVAFKLSHHSKRFSKPVCLDTPEPGSPGRLTLRVVIGFPSPLGNFPRLPFCKRTYTLILPVQTIGSPVDNDVSHSHPWMRPATSHHHECLLLEL